MDLEQPPSRRSPRKAKGDGHLRRAEILEAAERIFIAEGYEGATIRKIAEEVGVSSTALYMHFPDKGQILLEICDVTLRNLLERNREIAARPVPALDRVRSMLEDYILWGLEHPNPYQLVYSLPRTASTAQWPEGTLDISVQSFQVFRDTVCEVAAEGRLRAASADTAAQVFWTASHGLVALLTARPNFAWQSRDELIRTTLDGLMNGLVKA